MDYTQSLSFRPFAGFWFNVTAADLGRRILSASALLGCFAALGKLELFPAQV
jgi:hypothetical protein